MITLVSVRLKNFRAIKDATIEPLEDGITGLSGLNGVGKSAFLVGTLWALYGELPRDVKQSQLRNTRSESDEECFVQVEFDHNGDRVIVTRSLVGKSNNVVLYTWLNGNEATVRGVKVGQAWISQRLGVDAQGFTTAVLVQQKELDDLVTARPTKRRALIERLSGISKMSTALNSAREEANLAKRDADNAPGSEDDIDFIDAHLEEYEDSLAASEKQVETLTKRLENLRQTYNDAKGELDDANAQRAKASEIEREIMHVESTLETLQEDVASAQEAFDKTKAELPKEEYDENRLKEIQDSIDTQTVNIRALRRNAENAVTSLENALKYAVESASREEEGVQKERATVARLEARLSGMPEEDIQKIVDDKKSVEGKLAKNAAKQAEALALAASLQKSIDALHDANECPTCHQGIDDNAQLIADLSSVQESHRKAAEKAEEKGFALAEKLEEVQKREQDHVNRGRVEESLEEARTEVLKAEDDKDAADKRVAEAKANLEEGSKKAKKDLQEAEECELALEGLRAELNTYRQIERLVKSYDEAEVRLTRLQERQRVSIERLNDLHESLKSIDIVDDSTLASLQQAHDDAMAEGVREKEVYSSAASDVRLWSERVKNLQDRRAEAEKTLAAKRELLANAERKSATANVLDEFRKSQIARIAPELSDTATNLISQMTNGHFTEVVLDDDFTPSVVNANGETLAAAMLSGGEVSVVALSLRIAIADMLTGGTGGLLWLDEVLVSQDADRRASLIETLRSLDGRQIVMVNHTQGADDIVDRTIRLRRDDNGGTVVDES